MCQATVEDREHPTYHASMQRIMNPGNKACSRKGVEQVGPLLLCAAHARMAREGLVAEDGQVATKQDIAAVRRYPEKFPKGLYNWFKG
jgi:hypothetical protein